MATRISPPLSSQYRPSAKLIFSGSSESFLSFSTRSLRTSSPTSTAISMNSSPPARYISHSGKVSFNRAAAPFRSLSPSTWPKTTSLITMLLLVAPSGGLPICRRITGSSTSASAVKTLEMTASSPAPALMPLKFARFSQPFSALSTSASPPWPLAAVILKL